MATIFTGRDYSPDPNTSIIWHGDQDISQTLTGFQYRTREFWLGILVKELAWRKLMKDPWDAGHECLTCDMANRHTGDDAVWRMERYGVGEAELVTWRDILNRLTSSSKTHVCPTEDVELTPTTTQRPGPSPLTRTKHNKKTSSSVASASSLSASSSIDIPGESWDKIVSASDMQNILGGFQLEGPRVVYTFESPVNPLQILVLASCVKLVAPKYSLLTSNCFFFCFAVTEVALDLFGGTFTYKDGTNVQADSREACGRAFGKFRMDFLETTECKELLRKMKKLYETKWKQITDHWDREERHEEEKLENERKLQKAEMATEAAEARAAVLEEELRRMKAAKNTDNMSNVAAE